MTARVAGRLAWSLWSVTVALFAAALVLTAVNQGAAVRAGDELALGLAFLCFATVGALVASRRPGNAVGWICGAIGLTSVLSVAPIEYARYAQAHPGSLPAAAAVGWPAMWAWYPTLGLMTTFLLLLFPTGRLPSRRWLPVAWLAGATSAGTCLATAVKPAPPDVGLPTNPLGVEQMARPAELVELTGFVLLALGAIASVASVVVRFRRARGAERQQLKWFTYGAGALVLMVVVSAAFPFLDDWVPNLAAAVALGAVPVAIGIAILRHRLYDIDRILNRTLVYGLLTAGLGSGYAGVVLVLGQLFGGVTGDPPGWVVAGATLAVAATFQPARRRVQRAVDRRFNRRRYDAAQTIEAFSARLREQVDLDTLSAELLAVVEATMEPESAALWLQPNAGGRH